MKLEQIFEQMITEGIKFTSKEIGMVKKHARDILIGIEFEFNVENSKADKFIGDEKPDDEDEDEPEKVETHEVYEYEEYTQRISEIEQSIFDDEWSEKENEFKKDAERDLNDEYEATADEVGDIAKTVSDRSSTEPLDALVSDTLNGKLVKLFNILDTADQIKSKDEIDFAFNQLHKIKVFQDWIGEEFFDYMNTELENDNYDDLYARIYSRTDGSNHYKFLNHMEEITERLQDFGAIDFPNFKDFSDPRQMTFEFNTSNDELVEAANRMSEFNVGRDEMDEIINFIFSLNHIGETIGSYRRYWSDYVDVLESVVDELFEEEEDSLREELWDNIMEYSSASENIDYDDLYREIEENHNVIIVQNGEPYFDSDGIRRGSSRRGMNKVEKIRQILKNSGSKWNIDYSRHIEDVKFEVSVPEGVEVISNPIPLNDAFELMHDMFNFIDDVGNTATSNVGMHVNMSIRGKDFVNDNFDPVKLMMFIDNETMHDLFPVRPNVDNTLKITNNSNIMYNIATAHNSDEIIQRFSNQISQNEKFQGINFKHIKGNIVNRRRIEFRATGGKDYSEREKTLQWQIYRFAYAMMAAFDSDFLRKEYLREIMSTLDNYTVKNFAQMFKSFTDLRSFITKHDLYSKDEFDKQYLTKLTSMNKQNWSVSKLSDPVGGNDYFIHISNPSFPMNAYTLAGELYVSISYNEFDELFEPVHEYKNMTLDQVVKKARAKFK